MRVFLRVFTFVLLGCAQAVAQSAPSRGEIFAGVGASRVGGDEGSLGNGPFFLAGVGFRLAAKLSVEGDVMRASHERFIAGGPLEGTATGVFGSVLYRFLEGRVQPFVIGSGGLLRSETTNTLPYGGTLTTFSSNDTNFAWGGGGGVTIFMTPRFSLRPEARLVFSEATGVMGLAAASIGFGYHW